MSLHLGTGQVGGWTAVSPLLLLLFLLTLCATTNRVSAEASTFDAEPLLEKHAQQLSTTELSSTLHLLIDILSEQQEQPEQQLEGPGGLLEEWRINSSAW